MVPCYSVVEYFIVSPPEIHLLRSIVEAYEGIGTVTTLQPDIGLVQLNIAPGCEAEIRQILHSEKKRLQLRSVTLLSPP